MIPASIQTRLKPLFDRIDGLSLRERAMVFVGVMAVIYLVAMSALLTPLRSEHNRLEASARAKNEEIQAAHRQMQILLGSSDVDVDAPQRQRIAALDRELTGLDQQLEKITGGTVSPQQMAKLLEQVLAKNRVVELVKIEGLPPAPAVEGEAQGGAFGAAAVPTIYKHGVRIELRGRYFDIIEYLKAMESLPWKIFWGRVSLESDKYPLSKVTVIVYTLSRHAGSVGI